MVTQLCASETDILPLETDNMHQDLALETDIMHQILPLEIYKNIQKLSLGGRMFQ